MHNPTTHTLYIGNSARMRYIKDESIHLVVTSPPYFNAPFDYKGYYKDYQSYLKVLKKVSEELYRVLIPGRILVLNIDDMLVDGRKYPITADATNIFCNSGFRYRDRIIWKKPDGYIRTSKRSQVLFQNPYPMYFYPDNLLESIIIFQKGEFKYKSIPKEVKEQSKIDIYKFKNNKWYSTLWEMTNVLPNAKMEKGVAAFPEELPFRIISLFSYVGETVFDPFCGSGTTMKVARILRRNSIGIELNEKLVPIIKEKLGFTSQKEMFNDSDSFNFFIKKK